MKTDAMFRQGLLRRELFMGLVSGVSASNVRVNLRAAGEPGGSHFESFRYGRGEVGELVLIEGQTSLVLGRLVEVRLPEAERKGLAPEHMATDVVGNIQLLGTVRLDSLQVAPGVGMYPRLGDRVYAAPHEFVARIPALMERHSPNESAITLNIGRIGGASGSELIARPERLFGRHCAILGATGGGKSWTLAKLVEECSRFQAKVVLLDATGEYRAFDDAHVMHCHLGNPVDCAPDSQECSLPPTVFDESDFIAMFEPSRGVQGPKFREAVRSLRLAKRRPDLAPDGLLKKAGRRRNEIEEALKQRAHEIEDPKGEFSVFHLSRQILEECVRPFGGTNANPNYSVYGSYDESAQSFCLPLVTRIDVLVGADALAPIFRLNSEAEPLDEAIEEFLGDKQKRVLRLCLSGVASEHRARELMVNTIGRMLLSRARKGEFRNQPLLVFLDEAHHFLGRSIGTEESAVRLDAFELIAREGRKYGLTLCLATQRPRDLTENVLSQMGTLIVHRMTNDRDREIVERASGEIDRAASSFLPNLGQGEAVIIGTDFPIPLTVQIGKPGKPPISDGPSYQRAWSEPAKTEPLPKVAAPRVLRAADGGIVHSPADDGSSK